MFLTPDELRSLTGRKRRSAQLAWLRSRGIEPFVSAAGELFVCASVVEEVQRMASGIALQQAARKGPRPNLRAVT